MSTAPQWSPVDDATQDLLSVVADTQTPLGQDHYARFIAACKRDADQHGGKVSVQRVRTAMKEGGEFVVSPRAYSAMWSTACRKGGPMVVLSEWDHNDDHASGNGGKPQRLRRWVA